MGMLNNKIDYMVRGTFDELYTPKYAIYPILDYIKIESNILCPFDTKQSNYVKVLQEQNHHVFYSHGDEKSFFEYTKKDVENIDYIISNPPFSIKDKVLEHLFYLDKPFIILLPLTALEGQRRGKMFRENEEEMGFLILDKRINFMKDKKGSWFNTSYFTYKVFKGIKFIELEIKEQENE